MFFELENTKNTLEPTHQIPNPSYSDPVFLYGGTRGACRAGPGSRCCGLAMDLSSVGSRLQSGPNSDGGAHDGGTSGVLVGCKLSCGS